MAGRYYTKERKKIISDSEWADIRNRADNGETLATLSKEYHIAKSALKAQGVANVTHSNPNNSIPTARLRPRMDGRWCLKGMEFDKPPGFDTLTGTKRLDALGEDIILDAIQSGLSMLELSKSIQTPYATLYNWLHDPVRLDRTVRAKAHSAEGWLDRAMEAVTSAPSDKNEAARARAIAVECARRAALRNPAYRENSKVEHTGTVNVKSVKVDPQALAELPDTELDAVLAVMDKVVGQEAADEA